MPALNFEGVANRLLDLLDAGVFVYDGGVPRTKTRDDDPVLQFKLSYRKLLGLASFIGLSDRDRFELSGETLRRWLEEPEQARGILIDSEARRASADSDLAAEDDVPSGHGESGALRPLSDAPPAPTARPVKRRVVDRRGAESPRQLTLPTPGEEPQAENDRLPRLGMAATEQSLASWTGRTVDVVVVALGFEERTLVSAKRLLETIHARRVVVVRYASDQGYEIADLVARRGLPADVVDSVEDLGTVLAARGAEVIIDSSGLSKPFLFTAVRDVLIRARRVGVIYTRAREYYPRNQDLIELGVASDQPVSTSLFARLGDVLTGEAGPYRLERVHHIAAGPERWQALLASASPKNDRLLHLLDARPYDATRIFVPPPTTPRRRIARAAAELAASGADANVGLVEVDTNDLAGALRATEGVYKELYFGSGANVEIGLTGSKIHAVAFAALAAAARISAAWYVSPQTFDAQRFTQGAADTHCFDITVEA
jgi:hypothetical protein